MREIVFVTGLWRSGTSATAGLLKELGVYMGDEFNHRPSLKGVSPTGNWEEIRLKELCHTMMKPPRWRARLPHKQFQCLLGNWMVDQCDSAGARLAGGKHPIVTYFLPDLIEAACLRRFHIKLIDVERSEDAIVSSMTNRKFFGGNHDMLQDLVAEGLSRKLDSISKFDHIGFQFESLVNRTGEVVNSIVDFLGIEADSDTRLRAADTINTKHVQHGY